MFGRSKPVVFDPYRDRRRRGVLPAWLWLLLGGIAVGAAGVIVAQERWLPPRLSASETTRLRADLSQAVADRTRLQAELAAVTAQRDEALGSRDALQRERDALAARTEGFDAELAFVVDALPPDPRGGTVGIRAASFGVRQGGLDYALALSHDGRPLDAVLQLTASGRGGDGRERSADLQPVTLRLAPRTVARGRVPLPTGLTPDQVTVRVVDAAAQRTLGRRILRIR